MFCTKCGVKVSINQKFCNKCGNKLADKDLIAREEQAASTSSNLKDSQKIESPDTLESIIEKENLNGKSNVNTVEVEVVEPKEEPQSQVLDGALDDTKGVDETENDASIDTYDKTHEVIDNAEEKTLDFYCSKCGNKVIKKAKFCTKCGESLQEEGKIVTKEPVSEKSNKKKEKAPKTKAEKKIRKKKKSKGALKKILISFIILIFIVIGLGVAVILYTHYSEFDMAYKTIDYEQYIQDNIWEMIEEKSDNTYEISLSSDLINSALNSNLDMINTKQKDISISKTYFDVKNQRLYFTLAYKNFNLNLSSNINLKLDEKSLKINLDDFKAGAMNIPIPELITNLLPSDILKFSYDIEQIPDFIKTNEIKYNKDSIKVSYEIDYKFLANDFKQYMHVDNIDENIIKLYQYSPSPSRQLLGNILEPENELTEDDVKTIIDLYHEYPNLISDILVAFDKNTVESIVENYKSHISINVDSSSIDNLKKEVIRTNFFDWMSYGTAPGVGIVVGDPLEYMFDLYGYDYYYDDWNEYNYYYYEYLSDSTIESGGVIFLTPYSYYSEDYNTVTLIELYEPYDMLGFSLSMSITDIKDILGQPKSQYYDSDTGYYKTVYQAGDYLVSFYSSQMNSECYYFDIREK